MNKVSIKDILFKENPEIISKKPYPYTKAFRPSNLTLHKDKKLALGYFEKGRVGLLDKNNNILGTFEEYPFYNDNVANISNLFKGTIPLDTRPFPSARRRCPGARNCRTTSRL